MKTTTKKLSDTRVEIKVTLDSADLKLARDQALARLAANLKVPGFRKGKAPISMVEKQVSPNDIASETIDIAVHAHMPKAFADTKLSPIAIEGVNVMKYVPDESAEYVVTAQVLPDIKLGDYKKLKAKLESTEPTAKDVQEILDNVITAYAEHVVKQGPAAMGDEVIIDFVGKKDGEAFPGGSAKDHHLTLGSKQFIPGFEEGIVGHAAGDKFDLEVTFPKDYGEKSLAGQKAVFETLVKQVNEIKKPAEDDELAQKCGDFKNMDELKADIKKNLAAQNEHRALEKFREDLIAELVKNSKVAAPEVLIHDQLRYIKDDMTRNAASRGMSLEQYIERSGQTMEEWEKTAHEVAEARVKSSLVLQVLAKEQNVTATDEEVEAKLAELRDVYQRSKEALANLKKPEVKQELRNRLIIDKTIEMVVAANSDKKAKTAKKAAKTGKAEKAPKKAPAKKTTQK